MYKIQKQLEASMTDAEKDSCRHLRVNDSMIIQDNANASQGGNVDTDNALKKILDSIYNDPPAKRVRPNEIDYGNCLFVLGSAAVVECV